MTDDGLATSALPARFPAILSPDECRELVAEIDAVHHQRVRIWNGEEFQVDPESRMGAIALLTEATEARVLERLCGVVPELQRRFGCELAHLSAITALIYGRGDHFAAHSDGGQDDEAPAEVRRRRVSLVLALNDGASDFDGGELRFFPGCAPYDTAHAEQIVSVRSEPGLLIAFPSPMTHQVMPVRDGCRYSLALWALAPE